MIEGMSVVSNECYVVSNKCDESTSCLVRTVVELGTLGVFVLVVCLVSWIVMTSASCVL